jgi:hypothetical protein
LKEFHTVTVFPGVIPAYQEAAEFGLGGQDGLRVIIFFDNFSGVAVNDVM